MKKQIFFIILNLFFYTYSYGKTIDNKNIKYENCFRDASLHYKVPSNLLKAIANVESKMNPNAININSNGTYDVGIMQINSSWFKKLSSVGIQRGELLEGCKNIQVGAWILSQNIKKYGLSLDAIGRYNSSNSRYKMIYTNKVMKEYKHMSLEHNLGSQKVNLAALSRNKPLTSQNNSMSYFRLD